MIYIDFIETDNSEHFEKAIKNCLDLSINTFKYNLKDIKYFITEKNIKTALLINED